MIIAEHTGRCRYCNIPIQPGDAIQPASGWWQHEVCPQPEYRPCYICGGNWQECDCP